MDINNLKDKIEVILKNEEQPLDEEISLRAIIEALLKGKKLIAVTVIICLLAAYLVTGFLSPYRDTRAIAETIITFNFEGIEKGLDPHGRRFDLGIIKAPVVLDKVIESLELDKDDITVDLLRNNLEIVPIVPGDVVEKIRRRIEAYDPAKADIAVLEDYTYYPNRFTIMFKIPKDKNIDNERGRKILDGVIDAYIQYFYDTYSDRAVLANALGIIDYDDYDYPEVPIVMRSQINIMQSFLSAKHRQAPEFRSKITGLAFNDIVEAISLIDTMDLNRLNSIISSYRISKDIDKLIRSLEYRIKSYELSQAKKEEEAAKAGEVMDKFEKERSIVFMGGVGTPEGVIETEKTSELYDELAQRSLDSGISAAHIRQDIEYLHREIEIFTSDDDISLEVKRQAEAEVIAMIEDIDAKLKTWIDLSNRTLEDYFENIYFQRAIMRLAPVQVSKAPLDKLMLNMAIALVLGLMLGALAALFREYWHSSSEKKDRPAGTA
ncbi:MAG: hypothetical protein GXZ07_02035 [Firmicutes bacterium]|nr:hypothetical protein [Bacillota bacterium]